MGFFGPNVKKLIRERDLVGIVRAWTSKNMKTHAKANEFIFSRFFPMPDETAVLFLKPTFNKIKQILRTLKDSEKEKERLVAVVTLSLVALKAGEKIVDARGIPVLISVLGDKGKGIDHWASNCLATLADQGHAHELVHQQVLRSINKKLSSVLIHDLSIAARLLAKLTENGEARAVEAAGFIPRLLELQRAENPKASEHISLLLSALVSEGQGQKILEQCSLDELIELTDIYILGDLAAGGMVETALEQGVVPLMVEILLSSENSEKTCARCSQKMSVPNSPRPLDFDCPDCGQHYNFIDNPVLSKEEQDIAGKYHSMGSTYSRGKKGAAARALAQVALAGEREAILKYSGVPVFIEKYKKKIADEKARQSGNVQAFQDILVFIEAIEAPPEIPEKTWNADEGQEDRPGPVVAELCPICSKPIKASWTVCQWCSKELF